MGGYALSALYLVLRLPTRAIQPALLFPFALPLYLWLKGARPLKRVLVIATILFALIGGGLLIYSVEGKAFREKIHALWDSDNKHYITLEGQRAAHSERWRLTFWRRCIDETAQKAPLTGLGFGRNLTDLLRDTPDWPMFADSQDLAKFASPNRHPHSAHVSVFARLGIVGLLLWFAILFSALRGGLRKCLRAQGPEFFGENLILCVWLIYVLAMSFGVVLENPFGGIWFWALTGILLSAREADRSGGIPAAERLQPR
jgi:O-antigen ligase